MIYVPAPFAMKAMLDAIGTVLSKFVFLILGSRLLFETLMTQFFTGAEELQNQKPVNIRTNLSFITYSMLRST